MKPAYYTPANPGSFGGVNRLARSAKNTNAKAQSWLRSQRTYTLHKPKRKRFLRRQFYLTGIDDLWQADLADMTKLADENDAYKYLLVVIDGFSKYLWVEPTKDKSAAEVTNALEDIIVRAQRKPANFMTDKGGKFVKDQVRTMLQRYGINFYTAQNPETKAAMAERVIRTLKGSIYRYMTSTDGKRYINALDDIVKSYNASKHRTIGMAPDKVDQQNEATVAARLRPREFFMACKPCFNLRLGDKVRLAKEPSVFAKGYQPQWTDEVFAVSARKNTYPATYKVTDLEGEPIIGSFYEAELQRINTDDEGSDASVEL